MSHWRAGAALVDVSDDLAAGAFDELTASPATFIGKAAGQNRVARSGFAGMPSGATSRSA